MRAQYNILALILIFILSGCVAPRLGLKSVHYDDVTRQPTSKSRFIPIYGTRQNVPFNFTVIGEVIAAPMRAEQDFGYDPIELLKKQAREMGGIGLIEVESGSGRDSRNIWKAKVIVKIQ